MFNFNHLYYFYRVAQLGGVSKASRTLKVSQPSLSAQLKVLEGSLGRALFRKAGRSMELTSEGERIFQYCRRMFSAAEELERSLRESDPQETAQLRIGVSDQIDKPFVADILSRLLRSQTRRQPLLRIHSGPRETLFERLKAEEIDLALTNGPAYGPEYMEVASFDMPVGLVVSRERHREQAQKLLQYPRLKSWMLESGLGLILPSEKLKLRHETDQYLVKYDVRPKVVLESDVLSLVVRAVVDGAGMGFIPLPYLAEEIAKGTVVPVFATRVFWTHQLKIITTKRETLDPLMIAFKEGVPAFW